MEIELLYFDGCLGYQTALKHLEEVIKERGLDARVKMIKIEDDEQALSNRFLGSPTIRLNGQDIEPGAEQIRDFSLRCRLYLGDDKITELPSKKMIGDAIERAVHRT